MSARRTFLAGASAAAAFPLLGAATPPDTRVGTALVLSGGGARGAYEVGVIDALVRAAGAGDGVKLPGLDIVCGASIGAINAWFVATGQYRVLRDVWTRIAGDGLFTIKPRFRAVARTNSGIVTRIVKALALERGLVTDVRGVLDSAPLERWIARHVDPATPVVIPLVFTVTNLVRQNGVVFFRLPAYRTPVERAAAADALRRTVGTNVDVREADDMVLRAALLASTAIPVLFDPVTLPGPNGNEAYIDGGIADNTPVDVARALAKRLRVVLVDPPQAPRRRYDGAAAIGFEAFSIAQRRVTENALRSAVTETAAKRLLVATTPAAAAFRSALYDVDVTTVRPKNELPADVPDFDRQERIDATIDAGARDAAAGWVPYGA